MSQVTGVVGVSKHERTVMSAVERLRRQGYRNVKTFAPIPCDTLSGTQESTPKSPVRFFTLTGAILGFLTGLFFPIWTVKQWPLITGGKPLVSLPPFLVISFELTILFGGLFTLAGLVITGPLAHTAPQPGYDGRFSVDHFGAFIPCERGQIEEVKNLLAAAGVEEMSVEGE